MGYEESGPLWRLGFPPRRSGLQIRQLHVPDVGLRQELQGAAGGLKGVGQMVREGPFLRTVGNSDPRDCAEYKMRKASLGSHKQV